MAELTRCKQLSAPLISSPADISLVTPHGHSNTVAVPNKGPNIANKAYVDSIASNLNFCGFVDAIVATPMQPQYLNNMLLIQNTAADGVTLSIGTVVLITSVAPGVYTVVGQGILSKTYALKVFDSVYVSSRAQLWYCIGPADIIPSEIGRNNIAICPTTPNIQKIIDNVAGTFIFSAGTYVLASTLTISLDNTTIIGYGAKITTAGDTTMRISANNVRILGLSVLYSAQPVRGNCIEAVNCAQIHLQDLTLCGGNTACVLTGCTGTMIGVISTNAATGISVVDSADFAVSAIQSSGNDTGVYIGTSANIIISNANSSRNGIGLCIDECCDVIANAVILHSNSTGASIKKSTNCILNGALTNNSVSGITSDSDSTNTFVGRARNNAADIIGNMAVDNTPAGCVHMYAGTTVPAGWLLCDGSAVAIATFPGLYAAIGGQFGTTTATFNVPDLRNMFIRAHDARNSRAFGSVEQDAFRAHAHDVAGAGLAVLATSATDASINTYTSKSAERGLILPNVNMSVVGGTETRPININLNAIIKY
jgi:microcystin-dependent protein